MVQLFLQSHFSIKLHLKDISNMLFWVSFFFIMIIDCIDNTSIIYSDVPWLKYMYCTRNILYLCLIIKILFFTTYTKDEFILLTITFIIGTLSFLMSKDFTLFKLFILAISTKNQSSKRIICTFILIKSLAIVLTLLFWKVGILPSLYYQDDIVGYYYTYGFCHRNVLGANFTIICMAWFYYRYQDLKIGDVIAWIIIAIIAYMLSLSRTSLIIIVITIVSMYYVRKKEDIFINISSLQNIILYFFVLIIILCIVGSIFYNSNNQIWYFINKIFTKRFSFAHQFYTEYGFSLFGQNIAFVNSIEAQNSNITKLILDNAYMRLFICYGIIPGIYFIIIYFKSIIYSFESKNVPMIISFVIFIIYGISERYLLDISYQFPLLLSFSMYFFKSQNKFSLLTRFPMMYVYDFIQYLKKYFAK